MVERSSFTHTTCVIWFILFYVTFQVKVNICPSLPPSPGLVQPRDLSFSEIGSRSFRASWETSANNVESYLVQFKPVEGEDSHYVSMSVPGDVLTTLLPHLTPLTRYEVSVSAHYEKGTSLPVTGYETTTEGEAFKVYKNLCLSQ